MRPLHLFFWIALVALSALADGREDVYAIIEQASSFAEKGQLQRGTELFLRVATTKDLLNQLPKTQQAQLLHNIGFSFQQQGDFARAFEWLQKSAKLVPSEAAHSKAAFCANALGQIGLAAGHLDAAIKLAGVKAKPHLFLYHGELLNNLKRQREAVASFEKGIKAIGKMIGKNSKAAIKSHPSAEVKMMAARLHHGIGDALLNLQNATTAAKKLETALDFVDAAMPSPPVRGRSPQQQQQELQEARRLRLEIMASLGEAKRQLADWQGYEERTRSFLKEVEMSLLASTGDSNEQEPPADPPALSPYSALMHQMAPRMRKELSRQWLRHQSPPTPQRQPTSMDSLEAITAANASSESVIRLGIISRRFHHYPGTHLMLGLFKRFDRRRVNVSCFSTGPDSGSAIAGGMSEERRRLMEECDAFFDLSSSQSTAAEVAAAVLKARVQVLLDYDGSHDFNNQKALAALSAMPSAPVISSWLGFAGPVGYARSQGCSLVDRKIAPVETSSFSFDEALVYLPHTYQPQDPDQGAMTMTMTTAAAEAGSTKARVALLEKEGLASWWKGDSPGADDGLEEEEAALTAENNSSQVQASPEQQQDVAPFVFASFNRHTKLDPVLFSTWMQAMRRCGPHCILWLYGGGDDDCGHEGKLSGNLTTSTNSDPKKLSLRRSAAANGIHPSRIVFACKAPRDYHLRRFAEGADLQLDSLTYGAHTTASDGFYGGVPLVTMPSFAASEHDEEGGLASRVGASLLDSLALQQARASGVVHSLAAYENAAVRAADAVTPSGNSIATTLKRQIRNKVIETCKAQGSTCGGRLVQGPPTEDRSSSYLGLFDAQGFAVSLDRAARATHEVRALQEQVRSEPAEDLPSLWSPDMKRLRHVVVAAG